MKFSESLKKNRDFKTVYNQAGHTPIAIWLCMSWKIIQTEIVSEYP